MKQSITKLGEIIQGLILGILVVIAIGMMLVADGGGRVFQYQGF